ncbi:MAG TPA: HAD-IA family hydrolase [Gaiellaceae bacterium]|jgi:HAD superfamily hydrolase (TIGR01509 family)
MRLAELDCVTVDAYGTLLSLEDPVPALEYELSRRGVACSRDEIAAAFKAEIDYYGARAFEGRDSDSLARLRGDCCNLFLASLEVERDPEDFLPDFIASLHFAVEPGALDALRLMRDRGLALAVVSNWDCSLEQRLEEAGVLEFFDCVVSSALVGVAKPDPRIFHYALAQLSVAPARSLHIGDSEDDRAGATSAGMGFAWAPIETVLRGLSG